VKALGETFLGEIQNVEALVGKGPKLKKNKRKKTTNVHAFYNQGILVKPPPIP